MIAGPPSGSERSGLCSSGKATYFTCLQASRAHRGR